MLGSRLIRREKKNIYIYIYMHTHDSACIHIFLFSAIYSPTSVLVTVTVSRLIPVANFVFVSGSIVEEHMRLEL